MHCPTVLVFCDDPTSVEHSEVRVVMTAMSRHGVGCRVPGDDGLNLMTAALGSLPFLLHDAAALRVAQTHKYNRLPLPSEFLKAVEGELLFLAMQRRSLGSIQQSISNIRARRIAAARILHQ